MEQFIVPRVPLPILLRCLVSNRDDKIPNGLENEFLPESRPNPNPAVNSRFPIDLVPIYSDE